MVQISGGNNKQGFLMKRGALTHGHVHLLLSKGHSCYRSRGTRERKGKSVWGCTMDARLSVLNLAIIKKIFLVSLILLFLVAWSPKEPAESAIFSISLKKKMSANRCCEKAPKQRRQETQDQSTQDSAPCYSTCPAA